MRTRTFRLLLLLLGAGACWTACATAAEAQVATQPAEADKGPRVVRMSLPPKGEPEPALRYQLLPQAVETTPEDPLAIYYASIEQVGAKPDDQKELERIEELLKVPLADLPRDEARQLLTGYAGVLKHVDVAARRTRINWDLGVRELGFEMYLPSLSKWRNTARIVALRARLAIAEGRHDDAIRSLQTGYAMTRHVADGPTIIQSLVGVSIASLMNQQVEELLQAPGSPNLYWALATLPRPLVDLRAGVGFEASILYQAIPELQQVRSGKLSPQQWQELPGKIARMLDIGQAEEVQNGWQNKVAVAGLAAKLYPDARKCLLTQGLSEEQVKAMPVQQVVLTYTAANYETMRDDTYKWFYLPYWQAAPHIEQAEKRFEDPVYRFRAAPLSMFLPNLGKAYARQVAMEQHLAAMQTLEAVRMHAAGHSGQLPPSLDAIDIAPVPRSPVTGQVLEYKVQGNTFTLIAPSPHKGEPEAGIRYEVTLAGPAAQQETRP